LYVYATLKLHVQADALHLNCGMCHQLHNQQFKLVFISTG